MDIAQQKEFMYKRLDTLFAKLQQPVAKDFTGSADEYRQTLLKQAETLLSNSHTAGYQFPIDAQTKCHGNTFLYRAAEHDLPFLLTNLAYTAEKLNLAKAFWIAASQGNAEATEALLIFNPMLTWQDDGHMGTALHNSAYAGHKTVVQKIIDYCMKNDKKNNFSAIEIIEAKDFDGKLPLDYALNIKNYEVAELIGKAVYRCHNPVI